MSALALRDIAKSFGGNRQRGEAPAAAQLSGCHDLTGEGRRPFRDGGLLVANYTARTVPPRRSR